MASKPAHIALAQLHSARAMIDTALASLEPTLGVADSPGDAGVSLKEQLAVPVGFGATRSASSGDPETLRAELRAERERAEAAEAEIARMTGEFDAAVEELRQEHATVLREHAATSTSLPLDELLSVFGALRRATSADEVITALLAGLGREFPRAAVFRVHGNRLEGVQQRGFEATSDISKVAMPLSGDSLVARAARSKQLESFFPGLQDPAAHRTPFGAAPPSALAIPMVVGGSTIAILYADDPDPSEFAPTVPQTRAKFAELLHHHALLVLTALWFQQKAAADRREHAGALIAEIEHAHAGWVDAERNPLERQHDLKVAIDHSRAVYLQRMGGAALPDTSVFDEQLARAAEAQTTFGRDLATLVGNDHRTPRAAVLTMRR